MFYFYLYSSEYNVLDAIKNLDECIHDNLLFISKK